ncbi:MAG: hypothetical protein NTW86_25455, partial [Candidatus Sumerlaeota bacterium]|nr:hypothetical protein [Candidatus Sumerlaeota bacterium]
MDSLNEFIGNFPEDKRELAKRMVERKVSLRAFSDSFIATASLHNDNEHCKAMNGVFSVMVATAGMVATGFGCGVPIRGGIEIGLGLDIEDDEIYGPAIARAYDLESMVADYPRVLLGPELIGFLDEVRNQTPTSAFGNFAKGVAARCMSLVTRD